MDEGSSRWEFQYLKTVVGSLVEEAQARIQASERRRAGQEVEAPPSATLIPDSLPPYGVPQHLPLAQHVESRSCAQLSLPDFLNEYLSAKRPVVIKDYLSSSSWPGMERWHDLQFWRQQHGHRLVRHHPYVPSFAIICYIPLHWQGLTSRRWRAGTGRVCAGRVTGDANG
jgi:hypothetical protein